MSAAIATGPDAGLVNLSQGGALLEVAGRLSLGSAVRLKLMKAGGDIAVVNGKVAWQKVASIANGQINYRIAVAFDVPLDAAVLADGEAPVPPAAEEPAEPEPQRSPAVVPFPTAQPKPQPTSVPTPAPAASTAEVEDLRRKLGAARADLSCQSAILESLAAKLKDSEQQRTALIRQLADAVRRGDDLQAMLDARDQERANALREQQEGHEGIVAELLKAADDQQAQYRVLFERHQQDESRLRGMAERLEAAEAVSVAQQDRYRALRHEAEKLLRMIDAAAECGLEMEEETKAS